MEDDTMKTLREATFLETSIFNNELVDCTEFSSALVGEGCNCRDGIAVPCTCCGSSREL